MCALREQPIRRPLRDFVTPFSDITRRAPRRATLGGRPGWILLTVGLLSSVVLAALPAPYVIERPGPVFDTLGTVSVDGGEVDMISIPDRRTYRTEGSLSLLTVSVVGNRQNPPSWFDVILARFDPSRAVVPVDQVYPEGMSPEESAEQNHVAMENSQREAVAAALTELGHEFDSTLTVVDVMPDRPAAGVLEAGDRVLTLNGRGFGDVSGLQQAIAENGTERPARIEIERDGERLTLELTPVMSDAPEPTPMIGVLVGGSYDFPFQVDIQLENVGGPSAGLVFALGIIDRLTPGALTAGEDIAGTGTISAAGDVGPIGGIRQKLYGASAAGADWFLAPGQNCDEVAGHVPDGLTVLAVDTLDEALAAMEGIGAREIGGLPTCAAD